MSGAVIQFVDSISATPTVRLDLNAGTSWYCQKFSAPPPRLRRAVAQNAMHDGAFVASSLYDSRTIELELALIEDAGEWAAEELQKLFRELDRPTNYLRYQPNNLTKPVFFVLYRSDTSQLEDVIGTLESARMITVELLAEPFALGLKETLGPYTVSNNPAAASNGCYFDITGVIGDVPAPVVWWDRLAGEPNRMLSVAHAPAPAPLLWTQCESLLLYADTTNPGGGPDAAMSGTGVNNFIRTSFATTATMAQRLSWAVPATARGRYRVIVAVRRNGTTSTLKVTDSLGKLATVTVPVTSARVMLDLGILDFATDNELKVGYSSAANASRTSTLALHASRTGGTDTLDWDAIVMIPVGGQSGEVYVPSTLIATGMPAALIDSVRELCTERMDVGVDPTAGDGEFQVNSTDVSGGFPYVAPGVTNRCHLLVYAALSFPVTASTTVNLAYWPRYLFVRPAAS